jgi:hypothetical protein
MGYPKILAEPLGGKAADYDKNSSVSGRPDIGRAPTLLILLIQKAKRIVRDPDSAQAPRSSATARTEELSSAWNVAVSHARARRPRKQDVRSPLSPRRKAQS